MAQSYVKPSPAAALLQLARLKAGMSQRELAERASVPTTMISAYERDKRQPTLDNLLRLVHAAGFELSVRLEASDPHDEVLASLEGSRNAGERRRRDREVDAWRRARPVPEASRVLVEGVEVGVADLADVIRSKEAAGRPKDLQVLPTLYRHLTAEGRAKR